MRKTRLFLFLAILLCTSKVFAAASSVDFTADGIAYHITNSTTQTVEVTALANNALYTGDITIPATVTNTADSKVYDVTGIGERAFNLCTGMTKISIPASITAVGKCAFNKNTNLSTGGMHITDLSAWCRISFALDLSVTASYPLYYAHDLYLNDVKITDLTIPSDITVINNLAFYGCYLNSVTIPDGVTSIGEYAFQSAPNLTSVTIPNSVTSIKTYAFWSCSSLATVNSLIVDPSQTTIGTNAFVAIKSGAALNVPLGTTSAYANKSYWGFSSANVHETSEITMHSSGYATYCCPNALDFSAISGLEAYIVSSYVPSESKVTVTKCDQIPASTGMLLVGTPNQGYIIPTYSGTPSIGTNMLVGTTESTEVGVTNGDYTNLVLATVSGATSFYHLNAGGTFPAYKAYLPVLTSEYSPASSKKITINFENGGATDIKTVELNGDLENTIYNLQGQKVQNPEHGIYIVKGKKTYIK